jgi:hypothetical protein
LGEPPSDGAAITALEKGFSTKYRSMTFQVGSRGSISEMIFFGGACFLILGKSLFGSVGIVILMLVPSEGSPPRAEKRG